MLKQFTIQSHTFIKDEVFRNDVKYHYFLHYSDWNLFNSKNSNLISLKYILEEDFNLFDYKEDEEYKWIPTWRDYLDYDWNIKSWKSVTLEKHPWRLKYKVSNDNILISSLKWAKSSAIHFENLDLSEYVFSNWFYIFKIKENWNKKFILYVLKTKKLKSILDNYIYRWIWISAYRKQDLLKIKIPNLSKSQQDKIVAKIEPIENKIKKLKSQIKEQKEIINEVFAREFWFDENLCDDFWQGMIAQTQKLKKRKLKIFNTDLNELIKSENYRVSTRFHNLPTKKLMEILESMKTITIDKIIDSYVKWVQPEYDREWDIDVIKITNLKNWYIDLTDSEKISQKYFDSLKDEKKLRKNDIIICATWKGSLWKVDIFEWWYEAITSADNYIFRLKSKNNPLFFTYYFRSILWFFQIERDYTGATNQIHLYWGQMWKFKIPDINLEYQQKIVDEIKKEIDSQDIYKNKIEKLRGDIDKLIEESLK